MLKRIEYEVESPNEVIHHLHFTQKMPSTIDVWLNVNWTNKPKTVGFVNKHDASFLAKIAIENTFTRHSSVMIQGRAFKETGVIKLRVLPTVDTIISSIVLLLFSFIFFRDESLSDLNLLGTVAVLAIFGGAVYRVISNTIRAEKVCDRLITMAEFRFKSESTQQMPDKSP